MRHPGDARHSEGERTGRIGEPVRTRRKETPPPQQPAPDRRNCRRPAGAGESPQEHPRGLFPDRGGGEPCTWCPCERDSFSRGGDDGRRRGCDGGVSAVGSPGAGAGCGLAGAGRQRAGQVRAWHSSGAGTSHSVSSARGSNFCRRYPGGDVHADRRCAAEAFCGKIQSAAAHAGRGDRIWNGHEGIRRGGVCPRSVRRDGGGQSDGSRRNISGRKGMGSVRPENAGLRNQECVFIPGEQRTSRHPQG